MPRFASTSAAGSAAKRLAPLPSKRRFRWRLAQTFSMGAGLILGSLALGAAGYHVFEGLPWLDATLNASMILTGMGPVDKLHTNAGKAFGIFYSLFSGVVFLTSVAVMFAPVVRRFLHRFHLELDEGPTSSDD